MDENEKILNKDEILRLLGKLDEQLIRDGQQAVIYIVGGANMALAFDSRRSTTDVDVVVKRGFDAVQRAAQLVAQTEENLGEDWLNADLTGGSYGGGLAWQWFDHADNDLPTTVFKGRGLTVELASPTMMLALKTLARRPQDLPDIYQLMRATGNKTADDLGRNLAKYTGSRIFEAQQDPWMPIHIDPKFKDILEQAPDDIRPPRKLTFAQRRALKKNRPAATSAGSMAPNPSHNGPSLH